MNRMCQENQKKRGNGGAVSGRWQMCPVHQFNLTTLLMYSKISGSYTKIETALDLLLDQYNRGLWILIQAKFWNVLEALEGPKSCWQGPAVAHLEDGHVVAFGKLASVDLALALLADPALAGRQTAPVDGAVAVAHEDRRLAVRPVLSEDDPLGRVDARTKEAVHLTCPVR